MSGPPYRQTYLQSKAGSPPRRHEKVTSLADPPIPESRDPDYPLCLLCFLWLGFLVSSASWQVKHGT